MRIIIKLALLPVVIVATVVWLIALLASEDIWNGTRLSLGVVTHPDYSGMLPSDVAECCHFCGSGLYQLFTSVRFDRSRGIIGYSTT